MNWSWSRAGGENRREQVIGAAMIFILLFLFAMVAKSLNGNGLASFDLPIITWVRSGQSPLKTSWMLALTSLGSPLVLAVFALVGVAVFYHRGHRWEPLALLVSLVGGWAWDEVLKQYFQRLRPPGPWLAEASGYSFPSGHSTVAVGFYGVLAYFLVRLLVPKAWRPLVVVLATLVILLIGISRIYLGVHYPSDVMGGYALGGAWGCLCVLIGRAWDRAYRNRRS